jgi:hypothetical protein
MLVKITKIGWLSRLREKDKLINYFELEIVKDIKGSHWYRQLFLV